MSNQDKFILLTTDLHTEQEVIDGCSSCDLIYHGMVDITPAIRAYKIEYRSSSFEFFALSKFLGECQLRRGQ